MRLVLFFFLFSVLSVFAQKVDYKIDIENKLCHENSTPTTSSAIKCERKALEAWQKEMNLYLARIKKRKIN